MQCNSTVKIRSRQSPKWSPTTKPERPSPKNADLVTLIFMTQLYFLKVRNCVFTASLNCEYTYCYSFLQCEVVLYRLFSQTLIGIKFLVFCDYYQDFEGTPCAYCAFSLKSRNCTTPFFVQNVFRSQNFFSPVALFTR